MTARHPFLDHPAPLAIAHRGGSLEAEENTLPAFAHAVGLGYTHIELDVQGTADGKVVVHHDPTFARMFDDPRLVAQLDWAHVQRLRTRAGAGVPLLAEVLTAWPDLFVNIEPKSDAVVAPLAALLTEHRALDRIAVGSFSGARVRRLADALGSGLCRSPDWRGVLAVRMRSVGLPARRPDCEVLQVPETWHGIPVVTDGFVRAARAWGLPVQVWTVNEAADMVRLLDLGVDGIMTDRPTLLRELLRRRGQWHGRDA
jgi:glycerophosphoryl diester phosphodiesterase